MTRPTGPRDGMGNLSTKDADEELARLFLASVLRVPVTVHDRRSGHSTYDFEICYPGGRRGAAEVVSTRTHEHAAQLIAVRRADYTVDRRLTHSWIARVALGTMISRVRAVLPEFLKELEQNGITDLSNYRYTAVRRNKAAYDENAETRTAPRSRMDPVAFGASRYGSQLALLPAAWGLAVVPAECRREGVDG